MKLHLPVRLRKAVLACFSVVSVCTLYSGGIAAADDLTLADEDSLAVDYADSSSITDLSGGTLTLAGGTELLLTNCGEGDGKTYTLLTGVGSLLDAEGNPLTLTEENKAVSLYFDTTQPGTGFWTGGWLQLAPDGTLQLVLHGEEVQEALTITTRPTHTKSYNYYEGVCFRDITYTASGGAIYAFIDITLSNNGSVTFSDNTASGSSASGGAIYAHSDITLRNNGSVSFSGNAASSGSDGAYGGAILASLGSPLKINNNGETIFRGNYAHSTADFANGGAIHKQYGIFSIQNNASVVFEKNYTLSTDTLRLQSIYAYDMAAADREMLVNFSAPKGGKIEFRDSIHLNVDRNSASAFHLNNWYVNDAGERVAQTGDIIFTGEDATAENLKAILAEHGIHREATAEEIRLSKTSEVWGTMQLHDGQLIVREGAIIAADGITVHDSACGESTPTLWLDNGELSYYLNLSTGKNAVTISAGSALRLSRQNTARNSTLTLLVGSSLIIDVAAAHSTTAALTLESSTLTLEGAITLQLNAAAGLDTAGRYMLLSGVSEPTDWASNITVSGGVWTIDNLSWVNNTLYLNFPTLTEATWNNQSDDRLWNVNSSVNWEQHDIDYAYKDGIGVIFGDEGAGEVTLVGTLTPVSVLVNSTMDYSFEGSGSLNGGMSLTKKGSGTLSISTANSYAGGTMIEAGTVEAKDAAALGTGTVTLAGGTLEIAVTGIGNTIVNTGTSTLKVAGDITHILTGTIANSGELTFSGEFQTSGLGALSTREPATYENAAGVVDSTGGFSKSAIQGILLTSGSGTTVNSGATILHGKDILTLDSDGWATMGGEVSYGSYYIGTGHEVALDVIVNKAAENRVSTTNIQLNGGKLTANRALTGTLSISGTSTLHGVDFNLGNAPLQNNGDLTLTGSFDASGLSKTKTWNSYVTTSNEVSTDGSGFLREGDFEVTVVTGTGTVDSSGAAAMKYGEQNLTMAGGVGSGVGAMQYETYRILSGHTASSSAIHGYDEGKGKNALITLADGGTLNADDATTETNVSATGGSINLSAGTLSGTVGGSTAVAVSGTATMSGDNSYTGGTMLNGAALTVTHANALGTGAINTTGTSSLTVNDAELQLQSAISNSGSLTLIGNFNASKLAKSDSTDVYVDVLGNVTADGSGFTRSGDFTVSIANGTVDSTGATVSYKGTTLEMNGGVGLSKGSMLWGEYRILSGHEVELSAIVNKAADNQVSTTDIQLNGGKLTADRALTGTLSISGTSALHGVDFNLGNAPLQNSGDLTLTGSFDASGLSKTKTWNSYVTVDNVVSTGGSGFLREGDFEVTVVTGTGTVDSSGVTAMGYGTQNLTMDGAIGSGVGEMQYDTYRILSGHEVELSAIVDKAAENQVSTTDIQLNGGKLTANRALTGTLSISGTSALHGVDFDLGNAPLQNSGDLTLTGSFDASGLSKTKTWNSYVTTSNEVSTDGSGFLCEGDFEVTVVTGSGTVDSSGVTAMKYGSQNLTMNGAIGSGVGEMQYDTYRILSGHTANSSAIHGYDEGKGKDALITLADGGTLNADDAATETNVNATGGSINLSAGTLSGTVGGSTAVAVNGTATMSGDNSYTGGTMLNGAALTVTHANALGTGAIRSTDDSRLTVEGTAPLVLSEVISNATDGELTLEGAFDASALEYHVDSDGRIDLDGNDVANTASGFAKDVRYWVQIVDGGTTLGTRAHISHREHLSRQPLVLGSDGVASTGGFTDYAHFRLEGEDSFSVSEIAGAAIRQAGVELLGVTMRSGELTVDKSIAVNAEGGNIVLSTPAVTGESVTLSDTIANASVSSLPGAYDSSISATMEGTSSLTVGGGTISVSGDNSYSGGTSVNGGTLVAGSDTAFGSGDVAVNDGGTLDLGACTIVNRVLLSGEATLAHADGASNILLQSGANAGFANGFELSEGKNLTVGAGMAAFARSRAARVGGTVYRGALTLGGGELTLNEHLMVEGHVSFGVGTTTIVNVAGWQGAEAGTELASFSSNSGYTEESLTLRGAAAGLVLNFDAATGVLSLAEARKPDDFRPDLNRNQQEVYDTVKDIVAGGEKPEGELGELVDLISGTRNDAELRELLDVAGGSEYAVLMSSQMDGNLAHLRNLRSGMGRGWQLVGSNHLRAALELYSQRSELDADGNGRGYDRTETGGRFTLELEGCIHFNSGVSIAAGRTTLQPDAALKQHSDDVRVDFYTSYRSNDSRRGGYSGKLSVGFGTHDYDLERRVMGMRTEAQADGFSVNFMHESAYEFMLVPSSYLQVFGTVESSWNRIDGFRETGAGTASLEAEAQDAWATDVTLGLRYVQSFGGFALPRANFTLQAGVTASLGDTGSDMHLRFVGARKHGYTQSGAEHDRWGYNLGASLHLPISETAAVNMGGEAILRGDSNEWNANVGVQYAF